MDRYGLPVKVRWCRGFTVRGAGPWDDVHQELFGSGFEVHAGKRDPNTLDPVPHQMSEVT